MHRRSIPEYAMNHQGADHLRQRGILVMAFMDSVRDDPRRLQPHFHDFYQMYLLEGAAVAMLDFQEHRLRGLNAFFISPGQVHTVRPGRRLAGYTVSFTQEFFDDEAPPPSHLLELPLFFHERATPRLRIPQGHASQIQASFAELGAEYTHALPDAAPMLRAQLRLLLQRLARLADQQAQAATHSPTTSAANPPGRVHKAETLLRHFHRELESHFRTTTALPAYAARLGITANHLNDIVQQQTGHAAGELIRRRRLLDAKRQLCHSELTVAEIGHTLGFPDPSYFTRFFRRYEGVTPTEFRAEIREKYQ